MKRICICFSRSVNFIPETHEVLRVVGGGSGGTGGGGGGGTIYQHYLFMVIGTW